MTSMPQKVEEATIRIANADSWTVAGFAELMLVLQFLTDVQIFVETNLIESDAGRKLLKAWQPPESSDLDEVIEAFDINLDNVATVFRFQLRQLMGRSLGGGYSLAATKISYASPGSIDIAGAGKIVEQIRLFIKDVCNRKFEMEERTVKVGLDHQELLKRKIANAQALLDLSKSAGLSEGDARLLIAGVLSADNALAMKAYVGEIVSVESVAND
jgi:hypothetical protein